MTEVVQAVLLSVVGALTRCILLHSARNLNDAQMNMQRRQNRELKLLVEFIKRYYKKKNVL